MTPLVMHFHLSFSFLSVLFLLKKEMHLFQNCAIILLREVEGNLSMLL